MAILTPALSRLRYGFNVRFPSRDKTTDGWIGDLAHQSSPSGHNPDETGYPERRDADTIDEVRAIDVDKDLRDQITMLQVIEGILRTPNDRRRLIYIIYRGVIWSASRNWAPATYTGSNWHGEHAHFSGHPDYDNDASPWSVESIGYAAVSAEEDDMGASFGPININEKGVTSLTVPPVEIGAADPRPAWINFCNDTLGAQYAVRVWYKLDPALGGWVPASADGPGGGWFVFSSGQVWSGSIPRGTRGISVMRGAIVPGGGVEFVNEGNAQYVYGGHLTLCIERGPVVS